MRRTSNIVGGSYNSYGSQTNHIGGGSGGGGGGVEGGESSEGVGVDWEVISLEDEGELENKYNHGKKQPPSRSKAGGGGSVNSPQYHKSNSSKSGGLIASTSRRKKAKMTWRERNKKLKIIRYFVLVVVLFGLYKYTTSESQVTSGSFGARLSLQQSTGDISNLKEQEPYFSKATQPQVLEVDDVVLVTQLSIDRLQSLMILSNSWDGPMSITVFITSNEDLTTLINAIKDAPALQQRADIHLWIQTKSGPYPVNHLRNFSIKNSNANYFVSLDVDFIPSVGLYAHLRSLRAKLNSEDRLIAYVIPAFEIETKETPKTVLELYSLIDEGKAQQVNLHRGKRAHGPTDYLRWRKQGDVPVDSRDSEGYVVVYEYLWEPYLFLKKDKAPMYDERFIGFGNDRVSFAYEIVAKGFTFVVLNDAFIIHQDHGQLTRKSDQETSERKWKKWAEFVSDIRRKYNGFELEVPEWLKSYCTKNRNCPEFWSWFR